MENMTSLAVKAKGGDKKAKDELAKKMYPIASKLAYCYSKKIYDGNSYIDDYKSEAMIGMLEALSTFDSNKGSFMLYARYAMQQKIRDFITYKQRLIYQPKNVSEKITRLSKVKRNIIKDGGEVNDETIIKATGFSSRILKRIEECSANQYVISFDCNDSFDSKERSSAISFMDTGEDTLDSVIRNIEQERIDEILDAMAENDRCLLFSTFGAYGYEKKSSKEMALRFGISQAMVCYKRRVITNRLRKLAI